MVVALENEDWEIRELNKREEKRLSNTKCTQGSSIVRLKNLELVP